MAFKQTANKLREEAKLDCHQDLEKDILAIKEKCPSKVQEEEQLQAFFISHIRKFIRKGAME